MFCIKQENKRIVKDYKEGEMEQKFKKKFS